MRRITIQCASSNASCALRVQKPRAKTSLPFISRLQPNPRTILSPSSLLRLGWRTNAMNKTDAFLVWRSRIASTRHRLNKAVLTVTINNAPEPGQRSRAAEQRLASRRMTRLSKGKNSMMNMGQPTRHQPLPRFPSERERSLFAAHERRKEAGWIRG